MPFKDLNPIKKWAFVGLILGIFFILFNSSYLIIARYSEASYYSQGELGFFDFDFSSVTAELVSLVLVTFIVMFCLCFLIGFIRYFLLRKNFSEKTNWEITLGILGFIFGCAFTFIMTSFTAGFSVGTTWYEVLIESILEGGIYGILQIIVVLVAPTLVLGILGLIIGSIVDFVKKEKQEKIANQGST